MAGIIQVIKYEGDNSTFIWKHPDEDFNIGSQLIVHESQEAVFFLDGQALDLFGSGRYTLHTKNIPWKRSEHCSRWPVPLSLRGLLYQQNRANGH